MCTHLSALVCLDVDALVKEHIDQLKINVLMSTLLWFTNVYFIVLQFSLYYFYVVQKRMCLILNYYN